MDAYIDPSTNIDAFYNQIMNVDTAVGYGLDLWGRIVGVSRVLQIVTTSYFGFSGPEGPSGLPWNQGVFYNGEPLTANYALLDGPYRILILAKALKNICNASIPAINQILINLFGPNGLLPMAGNSYVQDGQDMSLTYTFSSPLGAVAQSIVYKSGVLPRPAGVLANVSAPSADFWNNSGLLMLLATSGWPTSVSGLPAGAVWSNSLLVGITAGISPDPLAPPIFFGEVTAAELLSLGGGNLPLADPHVVNQIWNNAGAGAVSQG